MPSAVSHMMKDAQCLLFILMEGEDFQTGVAGLYRSTAAMYNKQKCKGKVFFLEKNEKY